MCPASSSVQCRASGGSTGGVRAARVAIVGRPTAQGEQGDYVKVNEGANRWRDESEKKRTHDHTNTDGSSRRVAAAVCVSPICRAFSLGLGISRALVSLSARSHPISLTPFSSFTPTKEKKRKKCQSLTRLRFFRCGHTVTTPAQLWHTHAHTHTHTHAHAHTPDPPDDLFRVVYPSDRTSLHPHPLFTLAPHTLPSKCGLYVSPLHLCTGRHRAPLHFSHAHRT
jgi:hypothetical protein